MNKNIPKYNDKGEQRMKDHHRWAPLIPAAIAFACVLVGAVLLATPPLTAANQEGQYVGIDQCAACHEETVAQFRDSIHGKKGFEMRSNHSCETCHGPGKTHVDAEGGKGSMKNPASMTKEEKSAMCLTCHDRGTKFMWDGSAHDSRGLACQDCHSVHKPMSAKAQLKTSSETELCFSCHKQKKSQLLRASHHPIREGKMECSSCHNPHGAQSASLIDAVSINDKCYECHAEKRGPVLWEHFPAREDCMTCHEPHGTNHLRMLNAKEPYLCQRCHGDTRHPGTLYDQTRINSFSNRVYIRSCTNCHQQVHGSNHPSGNFLLR
jgi:DmsE family decaheme c-type cytochrome